jgi:ketosteroid isomerase-like protein
MRPWEAAGKGDLMAITDQAAFETGTHAFNARDLDRIADLFADDVVFQAPGGICGKGRAACIEFFAGWFYDFPDAHLEVHAVHVADDAIVEEGTFTGTHSGVARTDRPVALDYVQVMHFCEGKCARSSVIFDRLLMLEQLGLIQDGA